MPLAVKWTPLPSLATATNLTRSSHALAVVGKRAYVFGGELKPRTPVDGDLTEIGLGDGQLRTLSASTSTSSTWPQARVGATLTAIKSSLYLWGGRGGKAMAPFGPEEDLWRFDTLKESWEMLKTEGDKPEMRSFHVMTAIGDTLYLHAGCPSSGRLSTLHSLNTSTSPLTWKSLPSAPDPARGGTVLTPILSGSFLARFGGFAGYELDGLDLYDVKKEEWKNVEFKGEGPEKRSVHSLIGLDGSLESEKGKVVAVLSLGEREGAPAELGHDGAGFFHSDAWALIQTPSSTFEWTKLPHSKETKEGPQARGWLPSALYDDGGKQKVVLQGGLNEKNERLGDGWILEVVNE